MAWLSRLLRRLFGRPAPPRRAAPIDLGSERGQPPEVSAAPSLAPAALEVTIETGPEIAPEAASELARESDEPAVAFVDVDEEEQRFEEEERGAQAPGDPEADLDGRPDLDVIVAERMAHLGEDRTEAERTALAGETRVRLTDAAGPGTLAEALARLEREGKVAGRLEMDAEGSPVMVYAPLAPAADARLARPSSS